MRERTCLESKAPVFGFSRIFPRCFPGSNIVWTGFFFLAIVVVMACGQPGSGLTGEGSREVEGMVVEVVARNLEELETLRIRDSGGTIWTFTTEGYVGITPAHLREHQLFGDAVTITYQEKDGPEGRVLVASAVAD